MDGQLDRKSVNHSFQKAGTNWVLSSVISDPDFAESSAPAFSLSAGFGSRSNPRGELNTSIIIQGGHGPGTCVKHECIFL